MTTFNNGPASGQVLELRRAPVFLRVTKDGEFNVRKPSDKWDALDQPDDEPRSDETLYCYVLADMPTRGFVRRTGGGAFMVARYDFVGVQPTQTVMRDREKFTAWILENLSLIPADVRERLLG